MSILMEKTLVLSKTWQTLEIQEDQLYVEELQEPSEAQEQQEHLPMVHMLGLLMVIKFAFVPLMWLLHQNNLAGF